MGSFFARCRPGSQVTHGMVTCELPILYHRDDVFGLVFSCDFERVRAYMPSKRLHPVRLIGKERRAMLGIFAFNYFDASIGPYGELAVVVPVVHVGESAAAPPPLLHAICEVGPPVRGLVRPGYGFLVLHLPVTTIAARDAGRGEWGFAKFVADMTFTSTPEYHHLHIGEDKVPILDMTVPKAGRMLRDTTPFCAYSVRNGDLIKTLMPRHCIRRDSLLPRQWSFELGTHPVAESIRELELSPRPLLARTLLEKSLILPGGEIVESGVEPLDGYRGTDRVGEHITRSAPQQEWR